MQKKKANAGKKGQIQQKRGQIHRKMAIVGIKWGKSSNKRVKCRGKKEQMGKKRQIQI